MKLNRIFVDAHVFDGEPQGTTTYIKGLYNNVVKNKSFECNLAANEPDNLKVHFPAGEFKFLQLPSRSQFRRLCFDIPKLITSNKIDLAHFQYVLPLQKACKEVVTIHDILFLDHPELFSSTYRLARKFLFKQAAKRADLVLTVSDYSRDTLISRFNVDSAKIAVTPNGILNDYTDLTASNELPDIKAKYKIDKYLLYVSRIETRKNHLSLLRAFIDLNLYTSGYHLVFIGSNAHMPAELKAYLKGVPWQAKEKILLLANIPEAELKAFYKLCSMFVYPSLAEGFGIPPLEAATLGATTICSNSTAMSDFTFFGEKLFDPLNYNEMKEKISYYLNHPTSIETLANERSQILEKYNWEKSANTFVKSINTLL